MRDSKERREKWQYSFKRDHGWDSASKKHLQKKEARVIIKWLDSYHFERYEILEIGCGNGHIGRLVVEHFITKGIPFSYRFTDLLPESIELAKKALGELSLRPDVSLEVLDAYTLEEQQTVNIVISTGYASAATYKEVVPKVVYALKNGGVLIVDFINHMSFAVFFVHPKSFFKSLVSYIRGKGSYHFGAFGIKRYFKQYNLIQKKKEYLRLRRNPLLILFEKRD